MDWKWQARFWSRLAIIYCCEKTTCIVHTQCCHWLTSMQHPLWKIVTWPPMQASGDGRWRETTRETQERIKKASITKLNWMLLFKFVHLQTHDLQVKFIHERAWLQRKWLWQKALKGNAAVPRYHPLISSCIFSAVYKSPWEHVVWTWLFDYFSCHGVQRTTYHMQRNGESQTAHRFERTEVLYKCLYNLMQWKGTLLPSRPCTLKWNTGKFPSSSWFTFKMNEL